MKLLLTPLIFSVTLLLADINCTDTDNIEIKNIESCSEKSDKALNTVYKNLIGSHKGEVKPQDLLKKAQRAWIITRDAHCTLIGLKTSISPAVNMAICEIEMTQNRTKELEELFDMYVKE